MNTEHIKKDIEILIEPDQVFEIRMFNVKQKKKYSKGTVSGYYKNEPEILEKLIKDLTPYTDENEYSMESVYITLQQITPELHSRYNNRLEQNAKKTTNDQEVIAYKWLMIDLDAQRPAGISATKGEKQLTLKTANDLKNYLFKKGWGFPYIKDSGNGIHLYYKIDLPASDENIVLIKGVLNYLNDYLGEESKIKVDTTVFNPARITKLAGVYARKGDNTPKRPHRLSKIISIPEEFIILGEKELVIFDEKNTAKYDKDMFKTFDSRKFSVKRFLLKNNIKFEEKNGGYIVECPFNQQHNADNPKVWDTETGPKFHCFHNSCSEKHWSDYRLFYEPGYKSKKQREIENANKYIKDDFGQFDIIIPENEKAKPTYLVTSLPERLAKKIIEIEPLVKTEVGYYYYNKDQGIYELDDKLLHIKRALLENFGEGSGIDEQLSNEGFPLSKRPTKLLTTNFFKEIDDKLKTMIEERIFELTFNTIKYKTNNYKLAFNNGLYSFEENRLVNFSLEEMITNKLEANFIDIEKDAECKQIYDEFVDYTKSLVDSEEDYISLQEAMGYLMPFQRTGKKSIWIKGPADAGKTTFVKIILAVIGKSNTAYKKFAQVVDPKEFGLATLLNKSVNYCGDLPRERIKDMNIFKDLVGGDGAELQKKNIQERASVDLYTKFVVTTNILPNAAELFQKDILNRMFLILFKRSINEPKPDGYYQEKFGSEKALSAVAYWMLEGLKRYRFNGWTYPQDVEYVGKLLQKDTIETILEELTIQEENSVMYYPDFRIKYDEYCLKYGINPLDDRTLLRRLNKHIKYNSDIYQEPKRTFKNKEQIKIWTYPGLHLKGESMTQDANKTVLDFKKVDKLDKSDHNRKEIILNLAKRFSPIGNDDLVSFCQCEGISPAKAKELIEQLIFDGKFYSPRPNIIQVT